MFLDVNLKEAYKSSVQNIKDGLPVRRAGDFFRRLLGSFTSLSVFFLLLCFFSVPSEAEA